MSLFHSFLFSLHITTHTCIGWFERCWSEWDLPTVGSDSRRHLHAWADLFRECAYMRGLPTPNSNADNRDSHLQRQMSHARRRAKTCRVSVDVRCPDEHTISNGNNEERRMYAGNTALLRGRCVQAHHGRHHIS